MSVPAGSNSKRPNRSIRDTTSPGSCAARGVLGNRAMFLSWRKGGNRPMRAHRNRGTLCNKGQVLPSTVLR
ncbi:hypothetical protein GCM10010233_26600 [Streptomyces pseudogriseolus]|uniref:Uncharacterized protein n=1 Tax=Streptomyces pseudogriseolus TaxID=36817 RepID=A0ABQ2T912_STREZ|nr:hypothetical protein GCM10010233_26600 [Streptomyces gancidicus]GGS58611.1 hypothetical protein GCM10010285_42520 [Streptomyces rubiginosus]